jgi:tetratricopeptide (TPR) repeat protein
MSPEVIQYLVLGFGALVLVYVALAILKAFAPGGALNRLLFEDENAGKTKGRRKPARAPAPDPDNLDAEPDPPPPPAPPTAAGEISVAARSYLAKISKSMPGSAKEKEKRLNKMTQRMSDLREDLGRAKVKDSTLARNRAKILAAIDGARFDEAETLLSYSVDKDTEKGRHDPSKRRAEFQAEAAEAKIMMGDLQLARSATEEACLAYREAVSMAPGDNSELSTRALERWAEAAHESGQISESRDALARALALREAEKGPGDVNSMAARDKLIGLNIELGDLAAAEELAHRSQSVEQGGMESHWGQELTKRFSQIAKAYAKAGKVKEIMGPLITCIERMQQSNCDPNDLGAHHRFMGQTAKKLDQMSVAEDQFDRAVEVYRKIYGPKDIKLVPHIDALAFCHFDQRKYAEALKRMRESEAIEREAYGAFHTQIASRLFSIGRCQHALSDIADAENSYKQGIQMCETISGGNHADVATGLSLLGALYMGTGRAAEAVPVVERAVGIIEFAYGLDHPHMVPCLSLLGDVYRRTGRDQDAEKIDHRARDIATIHSVKMAPAA